MQICPPTWMTETGKNLSLFLECFRGSSKWTINYSSKKGQLRNERERTD